MNENITVPIDASLVNPHDPNEVTMVADVAGVGTTFPTSSGRVVRWTADFLRKAAKTLVGRPVNVELREGGVGEHSKTVVGTITHAFFDEDTQTVRVQAPLWKHYFPKTVEALQEIHNAKKKLETSVEAALIGDEDENEILTPTDGEFTGVGIVDHGADPKNRIYVLASALKQDREALQPLAETTPNTTVLTNSFEWIGDHVAQHLANTSNGASVTVTGTYPDRVYYSNGTDTTYMLTFSTDGDSLVFGEPVETDPSTELVLPAITPEVPSMTEQEIAEIQASQKKAEDTAAEWKKKFEDAEKELSDLKAKDATREREALAFSRLAEVEKIAPYTDEKLKTAHLEVFKTADETTFEAIKTLVAAAAAPKGGIAPEGGVPATDPDLDPGEAEALKSLPTWREELLASFGAKK